MGVRPPQGDSDTPDSVAFGISELDGRLDEADLSFPASQDEVIRALGDPEIDVNAHGRGVSLSTAMEETDRQEFDSERDLLNALHPVFETYREDTATGLMASIRSLLPF